MHSVDLRIDVTDAVSLGEPAHITVTISLPQVDRLPARPILCLARPGGGYSRAYYTVDLPGPATGAQAEWHAARGWIFASIDPLGAGESSLHDPRKLTHTVVSAANAAADAEIIRLLASGEVLEGFPAVADPIKLGVGQSLGGCQTIIQQGRHHCYDGIAVLGYSAIRTHPPVRPGAPPIVANWYARDTLAEPEPILVNSAAVARYGQAIQAATSLPQGENPMLWGFHYTEDYDDQQMEMAKADLDRFFHMDRADAEYALSCPPWSSMTTPGIFSQNSLAPGNVSPEAAAVTVPVLVAVGERDTVPDLAGEPRAYLSAPSVDIFVCPRMSHMHNFAATRTMLWERIEQFGTWVARWSAGS